MTQHIQAVAANPVQKKTLGSRLKNWFKKTVKHCFILLIVLSILNLIGYLVSRANQTAWFGFWDNPPLQFQIVFIFLRGLGYGSLYAVWPRAVRRACGGQASETLIHQRIDQRKQIIPLMVLVDLLLTLKSLYPYIRSAF